MKNIRLRLILVFIAAAILSGCNVRLINVPGEETGYSNEVDLDVTVEASEEIKEYQFKLVPSEENCSSDLASYSPFLLKGAHLISNFSSHPDGLIKLCVRLRYVIVSDDGVNPPVEQTGYKIVSAQWTKDTVPPGPFTISGPSGTQATSKPTISWTPSDGASKYSVSIASDSSCQNIFKTLPDTTETTITITDGIPNGFWRLCVKAKDLASNETPASNNGILMTVDAPFHYLFVTSTPFSGSEVLSLNSADEQCTLYAFIGNLIPDWNGVDVVYKAVLSNSTIDAKTRLNLDRSIFNRNNQYLTFGESIWSGELSTPVSYDENGFLVGGVSVWTGTNIDGTYSGSSCSDWTSSAGTAMAGLADQVGTSWISNAEVTCNTPARLYCIGPF